MKANEKLSKIKGAQFYKVGCKVEAIRTNIGAWFEAEIIDIKREEGCECSQNCRCTYVLLFKRDDNEEIDVAERKISEIREISYFSITWDKLQPGMRVVINYNIARPKQWGYWYDYIIEDVQQRNEIYYVTGTLLVGYEGSCKRLPVEIDSDHVADVLAVRPPVTISEKESDSYETGTKPEYCKKCRNRPKVNCKTCCCCKCGSKKHFELTVQCDECLKWYHTYCIKPPLAEPPADDEDWYCPKCNNETRRAKWEIKQKKLKKNQRMIKKNKTKTANVKKVRKIPPELLQKPNSPSSLQTILDKGDDIITEKKEIFKSDKVWEQIKQLFPDNTLIRVTAEVAQKYTTDDFLSEYTRKLIANDVANKHLWEEAMKSLILGKVAFLETVSKLFTCSICCEILDDPITLSCNHSFCIDCFFRSLSVHIYKCCLCRVDIIHTNHFTVNENLRDVLHLLFKK